MHQLLPKILTASIIAGVLFVAAVCVYVLSRPVITPDEARQMLLDFVRTDALAKDTPWVSRSREYLEKGPVKVLDQGSVYSCGPWVIDPVSNTAVLDIDRAQLDVSFARIGGRFVVTDAAITEVRRE